MVEYTKVESSNIDKIGYLDEDLYVTFKSGVTYKYNKVPVNLYEDFLKAESKGKFMNAFKKNGFKYERVVD